MAQALYHPVGGYYRRGAVPWGFRGKDYYTALDLGSLLGQTVAVRLRRAWEDMGRPQEFTVLEPGAGRGWLGRDILDAAMAPARPVGGAAPEAVGDFASCIRYVHCDDGPAARREAEVALAPWLAAGRARFAAEADCVPPFVGAVVSNEFFDALPAQPWRWDGEKWEREILAPPEVPEVIEAADAPPTPAWEAADPCDAGEWFAQNAYSPGAPTGPAGPEDGLRPGDGSVWVESLPAVLERVCAPMRHGLFIAIDYGDTAARLLVKGARLRRYRGHTVDDRWWEDPGECDLTADVDLTRLAHLLEKLGLRPSPQRSLGAWVCASAPLAEWEAEWQTLPQEERAARSRNLMNLTLPSAMGDRFRVLEAVKG
jgi:SAM-dependent MidA family methyltransferase